MQGTIERFNKAIVGVLGPMVTVAATKWPFLAGLADPTVIMMLGMAMTSLFVYLVPNRDVDPSDGQVKNVTSIGKVIPQKETLTNG